MRLSVVAALASFAFLTSEFVAAPAVQARAPRLAVDPQQVLLHPVAVQKKNMTAVKTKVVIRKKTLRPQDMRGLNPQPEPPKPLPSY